MALLQGPDAAAAAFPIPDFAHVRKAVFAYKEVSVARKQAKTEAEALNLHERMKKMRRAYQIEAMGWARQTLCRRVFAEDGFRERLTFFWADHFTARDTKQRTRNGFLPYVEDSIRPHVIGRFADMLKAVITHPVMLEYLDQAYSIGPNSKVAQRRGRNDGMNENLARELLELHLLGVEGPYTQTDVRQLAELLTGLRFGLKQGFHFQSDFAEPGPVTILGHRYGDETPALSHIIEAMEDLARHPATARHIGRKLAIHFLGDAPDNDLVAELAARFLETDGDLPAVYEVLLNHPASWYPGPGNVKQPVDFIGSALRALDLVPRHVPKKPRDLNQVAFGPLRLMGQAWGKPLGPDGWPEDDSAWITPQRMAARIHWAMRAPFLLRRVLPDPRAFLRVALGDTAPKDLIFAASAAETRPEGIGIILASPQFQRM
ncbi:DUF1800 domain-containing protein [Roseovarius aestuariivivens]|uniref:DUF1800 domain-containing protein n=1 Tax=Roseovarius aestuariivivens TaxID=1888910 RepID=UPI003159B336